MSVSYGQYTDHDALRQRLAASGLPKDDIAFLDQLVVSAKALQEAVQNSSEKIGGKAVIVKLPFGVDLVK